MTRAWSTIFPIALLPLIFHWMPLWRRNGIWFGVTVAPGYEDCPQARTVLHSYRIAIWLLALAALAVTAFGPPALSMGIPGGHDPGNRRRPGCLRLRAPPDPAACRAPHAPPHSLPGVHPGTLARRHRRGSGAVRRPHRGGALSISQLEPDPRTLPRPLGHRRISRPLERANLAGRLHASAVGRGPLWGHAAHRPRHPPCLAARPRARQCRRHRTIPPRHAAIPGRDGLGDGVPPRRCLARSPARGPPVRQPAAHTHFLRPYRPRHPVSVAHHPHQSHHRWWRRWHARRVLEAWLLLLQPSRPHRLRGEASRHRVHLQLRKPHDVAGPGIDSPLQPCPRTPEVFMKSLLLTLAACALVAAAGDAPFAGDRMGSLEASPRPHLSSVPRTPNRPSPMFPKPSATRTPRPTAFASRAPSPSRKAQANSSPSCRSPVPPRKTAMRRCSATSHFC